MNSPSTNLTDVREHKLGVSYALAAYGAWGLFPIYWKLLSATSAVELVAHRILWSFVFVGVLLTVKRRWADYVKVFQNRRAVLALMLSTTLITGNWLLYIWSVNVGRVTEGSLGYYINPLVNVLLASVFLGEKLRPWQWAAVGLAALGVLNLAVGLGVVPWVSLGLALSFALYGLVRKLAPVDSLTGLAVETSLAVPAAVLFLGLVPFGQEGRVLGANTVESLLMIGTGLATALPLLWFAHAARRLRYSTLGLFQYIAPTVQLLLAVLVYGEAFTSRHAVTFALIWGAVILYAVDGFRSRPLPIAPTPQVASDTVVPQRAA